MPLPSQGGGIVRGHQIAMAFMSLAAGLDPAADLAPVPYLHFDIAGATLAYPEHPSGRPLMALCQAFLNQPPGLGKSKL